MYTRQKSHFGTDLIVWVYISHKAVKKFAQKLMTLLKIKATKPLKWAVAFAISLKYGPQIHKPLMTTRWIDNSIQSCTHKHIVRGSKNRSRVQEHILWARAEYKNKFIECGPRTSFISLCSARAQLLFLCTRRAYKKYVCSAIIYPEYNIAVCDNWFFRGLMKQFGVW